MIETNPTELAREYANQIYKKVYSSENVSSGITTNQLYQEMFGEPDGTHLPEISEYAEQYGVENGTSKVIKNVVLKLISFYLKDDNSFNIRG